MFSSPSIRTAQINEAIAKARATKVDMALLAAGAGMLPLIPWAIRQHRRKKHHKRLLLAQVRRLAAAQTSSVPNVWAVSFALQPFLMQIGIFNSQYEERNIIMRWLSSPESRLIIERVSDPEEHPPAQTPAETPVQTPAQTPVQTLPPPMNRHGAPLGVPAVGDLLTGYNSITASPPAAPGGSPWASAVAAAEAAHGEADGGMLLGGAPPRRQVGGVVGWVPPARDSGRFGAPADEV